MSSPPWFRFYSEALTDRKIERICRATQENKRSILGAWTTLMALANSSPIRGVLLLTEDKPFTIDDIADEWGDDLDTTKRLLDQFIDFQMIDTDEQGAIYITNWDKRQFSSDSSTARVRAFRERQRQEAETVTPDGCDGNGDETLHERYGNAPETETDQNRPEVQPSAGQSDDAWLSESRIVPAGDSPSPSGQVPADPLAHALQAAQAKHDNWAIPPDAGGADDFASDPLAAFCRLVSVSPDTLPEKKRRGWAKELRGVGEEWGVGPPTVATCIDRIPDSEYHWKTYSSPHQDSFKTDLGTLIGQYLTEQKHGPPQKVVELRLR